MKKCRKALYFVAMAASHTPSLPKRTRFERNPICRKILESRSYQIFYAKVFVELLKRDSMASLDANIHSLTITWAVQVCVSEVNVNFPYAERPLIMRRWCKKLVQESLP